MTLSAPATSSPLPGLRPDVNAIRLGGDLDIRSHVVRVDGTGLRRVA